MWARENAADMWMSLQEPRSTLEWTCLALAICLSPVNWGLEALKWQHLVRIFYPLGFRAAWQGVVAGIALSLFTPNRVGEYGGRILVVPAQYNWRTVMATGVGNFAQLLALVGAGFVAALIFAGQHLDLEPFVWRSALFVGTLLMLPALAVYFSVRRLLPALGWFRRWKYTRKLWRQALVLRHYHTQLLAATLGWSVLRLLVYSGQFWLLLWFFGAHLPLAVAAPSIGTVFFIQTSIPLPPVLGLFARGEVALYVFGYSGANELAVLAATLGLFVINLAVPALLGAWVVVKTNVLKSLGYEKQND